MTPHEVCSLPDGAARRDAEGDLSRCFLVEAAAGTGKTTLLVNRILTIVRTTQTSLANVVAITFTEKAAGELKAKLRAALENPSTDDDEEAERCRHALRELDAMPVSTIHAFCRELIQQRPVEANVDPGFTVADEQAGQLLTEEAWQSWIAAEFSQECPAARPFLEAGVRVEGDGFTIQSLFELLYANREDLGRLHVPYLPQSECMQQVGELRSDLQELWDLQEACRDAQDTLAQQIERLRRWAAALDWTKVDDVNAAVAVAPLLNKKRVGRKENWTPEVLARARDLALHLVPERIAELQRQQTSANGTKLVHWLKDAVAACSDLKSRRALLDFQDLLIVARDMLKTSREAREFFKSRYHYVLVDEFQDTDPLQTEVVFFLCEKPGRFASDWEEVELEEGKLFIVGDPKQSIYRFRRADLDLYGRVKRRFEESAESVSIHVNFRSHPVLIDEVNAVMERCMSGPVGDRYEPDYVAMVPHRPRPSPTGRAILLPPPAGFDLYQPRASRVAGEAIAVADWIARFVQSRAPLIGDGEKAHGGGYRDIAVLYPTTTYLETLERALRAREIPYQVSGGRELPKRAEMIALRSVLRAVDHPHDEVNVVGALRSPFFGCSDEELLAHRLDGGSFVYTESTSCQPHVERSFAILRRLHADRRMRRPSETVSALFDATAGVQVFALKPQGAVRVANLLKVLDLARSFEAAGRSSFHTLAHWLDRMEELRLAEDDSPVAEPGDDAVQLLTFHKSKGLEFPTVVLFDLGLDHDRRKPRALVDRHSGAVEFSCAAGQTSGYQSAVAQDTDRARHETMRLLYVAATRARDVLVIPAYWRSVPTEAKDEKSWYYEILNRRLPADAEGVPRCENTSFQLDRVVVPTGAIPVQESLVLDLGASGEETPDTGLAERDAWRTLRDARAARLQRPAALIRPSEPVSRAQPIRTTAEVRSEQAAQFGRLVHRMLQRVSLPDGADLESIAAEAAEEFPLSEPLIAEGQRLVRQVLESGRLAPRIASARRLWRELTFTAQVDDRLIEGIMDLVFEEDSRMVIVDFKTDQVSAGEVESHAERYRHQAAAYAQALEKIAQRPVGEVLFYFLRPDVLVPLARNCLSQVPL